MSAKDKIRRGSAGVLLSAALCAVKIWAGTISGSTAVLSDALNAFLDVLAYSAILVSVRIQDRGADSNHPFGHRRAEPLGGLLIAVFASVLGAIIIRDAILDLFDPGSVRISPLSVWLLLIGLAIKSAMAVSYLTGHKRGPSPAMKAAYVDSRNDVFASLVALFGFFYGGRWDDAAALAIGAWIVYSGVRIGLENVGYLMGESPGDELLDLVRRRAQDVPGVLGLNDLRAHFVGDRIHLELHIEVDKLTPLQRAHDIGVQVKRDLEALALVQDAFIHIDPI